MLNKLEYFFINNLAGRILVRVGASVAAYLASGKLGASVQIDPAQITLLLTLGAHALVDLIKHLRGQGGQGSPATPQA